MTALMAAQSHAAAFELSVMQDDNYLIYSNGQRKPSATAYMLPFVISRVVHTAPDRLYEIISREVKAP